MADTLRHQHFPRAALLGAGAIIVLTIAAAGVGRITGPVRSFEPSAAVASRNLRFEDRPDGSVAVRDARDGAPVAVMAPATNGFLRATLRGLARERYHQDLTSELPFRLTRWADGRLTLEDPATHREVELEAFGETNEAVFARLLSATGDKP